MSFFLRGISISNGVEVVTTSGTIVPLSVSSVPTFKVDIQALLANSGTVTIGGTSVLSASTNGIVLNPGNVYTITDVNDLNKIWVDASANGNGVSYVYYY